MATPSYSDKVDPEMIEKIIGQNWEFNTRLFNLGILKRDPRPLQGTQVTNIRSTRFQAYDGQNVAIGDPVSSVVETQTTSVHPIIWKYRATTLSDIAAEIEVKDAETINVGLAGEIQKASAQDQEDSIIATIKGVGAALTANQSGATTTTITLATLLDGKAALEDMGESLNGGIALMRSEPYYFAAKLGLVASTSNTMGPVHQTTTVNDGSLPSELFGMTPIISNKLASLGSDGYYIYYIGREAINIQGSGAPNVKSADLTSNRIWGSNVLSNISFGIGFYGTSFGASASETISDTALATSTNWSLSDSYAKYVKIARVACKAA
jgi:hypothetical protein